MAAHAFLDLPDGMAVRIGPAGLLIGRHRGCDILLADETASRRHALLRLAPEGIELIVLGRQPVEVDGREVTAAEIVGNGARLAFPGFQCAVRIEQMGDSVPATYCLRRGSERIQITESPFVVGTGPAAHVVIAGWPAAALVFQIAQGALYVEMAGALRELQLGEEVSFRGQSFVIEQADETTASTVSRSSELHATGVVLEPLPRGGRATFTFAEGERAVYLPGRRFRLISALARTPREYMPDSDLIPLVWDDTDEVGGRQDINVLLTRCRQDLVAAGISATSLIERAPGGRATRLVLAASATVRMAEQS